MEADAGDCAERETVTDAVQIALIAATPGTIVALTGAFFTYRQSVKNGEKIEAVHIEFNSRMQQFMDTKDALAEARVDGSYEAGVRQGTADEQERMKL